jgi:hypothetical protein
MIDDTFEPCLRVQGFLGNELFHEHVKYVYFLSFLCTIDQLLLLCIFVYIEKIGSWP